MPVGEAGSTVPRPREMGKDQGWVEGRGEGGGREGGGGASLAPSKHCIAVPFGKVCMKDVLKEY